MINSERHIRTTIPVAVTLNIDVIGYFANADDLIKHAVERAIEIGASGTDFRGNEMQVEGATPLANREAIEEMFS